MRSFRLPFRAMNAPDERQPIYDHAANAGRVLEHVAGHHELDDYELRDHLTAARDLVDQALIALKQKLRYGSSR